MHLIIDAGGSAAVDHANKGMPPDAAWEPHLARLRPTWRLQGHADSLSTPAERARLRLMLGRSPVEDEDGRLPWMAWQLGESGAWARLTPFHGLVGSDRITFVPPAELALDADESQALFEAVRPLFESDGVHLRWVDATTWAVRHDSLQGLPCASVDRVAHDSVQLWQVRTPLAQARLLRRLQNEAQMVLHGHAVNEARTARGLLPVNSLWLSDAGAADALEPPTGVAATPLATPGGQALTCRVVHPREALAPVEAWLQQDRALPEAPVPTLVLCGRAHAQAFEIAAPPTAGVWARLQRLFAAPAPTPTFSQWWSGLDETP